MERREIQAKISEAYESGNLIVACAWCGRLCLDGEWVHVDQGTLSTINSALMFSHGICPSCGADQIPEVAKPLRTRDELLAIALGKGRGGSRADKRQLPDRRSGAERRMQPGDDLSQERRIGGDRRHGTRRLNDTRSPALM